jgi:hypothetical protein
MKRGLLFVIDALIVLLVIALVCFPLIASENKTQEQQLSKISVQRANAFYTGSKETYTLDTDKYCEKIIDYNIQNKIIYEKVLCGEKK